MEKSGKQDNRESGNQEIWKETLYDEKLEIDKKKFIIGVKKSKWQKYCIIEINFKSVKL